MILLVLDNYASFREKMYRSEDALVQIISAARSCGIYLIITGNSKGAIYYKITEQIPNKVVLNMNDSGAYRDILNVSIPIVPEQTKGRALTTINKKAVEVQFAVPFNTSDEALRTSKIHEIYSMMREVSSKVEYHCDMSALDDATDLLEMSYVPASETKMEVLASIEDDGNSLIIGSDVSTKELKGFELTDETRIFVGVKDNSSVIPCIINRYASNSEKRICLITSKDTNEFDYGVETIDDVDEFISEYVEMESQERQNILLVIDGFCDFYDRISDEALFVLERALKANAEMNIVTFDSMQRLKDYRDTGLYVYLVRSNCGVILGGCIDDTIAAAITTEVYDIPQKFREKSLKNSQAIIYRGKEIAYIDIERG